MATRVVPKCMVGVVPVPGLEPVYVLLDEVTSTQRWRMRTLGPFALVLKAVFDEAAAAEASTAKVRGKLTAEAILKLWLDAFKRPAVIGDTEITLRIGKAKNAPIPEVRAADALERLIQAGHAQVAEELRKGPVKVQLYRDCALLVALYGPASGLGFPHVLSAADFKAGGKENFAPAKRQGKWSLPPMTAYAFDANTVVAQVGDGASRRDLRGAHLAAFIAAWAYEAELLCSGAGRKAIAAFRRVLQKAAPLPDSARVTITGHGEPRLFARKAPRELLGTLGFSVSPGDVAGPFSFRLPTASEATMRLLAGLRSDAVDWCIPLPEAGRSKGPAGAAPKRRKEVSSAQMLLF